MAYSVEEEIEMLAGAELLTERQAEAYVYREIERLSRDEAAERMGISLSTLDDYRSDAAAKIEQAEGTLDVLKKIQGKREANV
jgi:DNA-directed RNA polymerase specialized sigma24 family protein